MPDESFLASHDPAPMKNGAAIRHLRRAVPAGIPRINHKLWQYYALAHNPAIRLYPDCVLLRRLLNRTAAGQELPLRLLFRAAAHGTKRLYHDQPFPDAPHARLCSMDPWDSLISGGHVNDIQWRYDELNHHSTKRFAGRAISTILRRNAGGFPVAIRAVSRTYYSRNPKCRDGRDIRIEGCTSLFD